MVGWVQKPFNLIFFKEKRREKGQLFASRYKTSIGEMPNLYAEIFSCYLTEICIKASIFETQDNGQTSSMFWMHVAIYLYPSMNDLWQQKEARSARLVDSQWWSPPPS